MSEIIKDKVHEEEMVDRLLDFKGFIDSAIPIAFSDIETATTAAPLSNSNAIASTSSASTKETPEKRAVNRSFLNAATDAFTDGFRVRRNKPAEMIAKFLDRAMRRGQKGSSDEEFMRILDIVLGLYRYTQGKFLRLNGTQHVNEVLQIRTFSGRSITEHSRSDSYFNAVPPMTSRKPS